MIDGYGDLEAKAAKAFADYRSAVDSVRNDKTLTQVGQAQAIERIRAAYDHNVELLRLDATLRIDADTATNAVALRRRKRRAAQVDAERQVIGDVALTQAYILRVQALSSEDILKLYENSAEGFEKTLVGELVCCTESRIRAEGVSTADIVAANGLAQVDPPALRKLEDTARELAADGERFVESMDRAAEMQRIG